MTDKIKSETDMEEEKKTQEVVETKSKEKIDEVKTLENKKIDNKKTQTDKPKQQILESSIDKSKQSSVLGDTKLEDKKEPKKSIQKRSVVKKEEVVVNGTSLPISTKYSVAICKFIKGKKISRAIEDLEQVIAKKKPVPMKGEIPHRKGKRMMSGRFPKKASENFIKLLKSLQGNANNHDLEDPTISEVVANLASRPFGRFGRVRKKRTHVRIVAREKKIVNKLNKK